jgi:DNA-binding transcriptional MerR regulator
VPNSEPYELLTTSDVAYEKRVHVSTVQWWRRTGRLQPWALTPSGMALYRREDLRLIARRQRGDAA